MTNTPKAQNGWAIIPLEDTASFLAPNGKLVYCHPYVVDLLAYVVWHWHFRIEPLPAATYKTEPHARSGFVVVHGWRPGTKILGTKTYSNHGSGTALDVNGHKHPYEYSLIQAGRAYHDGFTYSGRLALRAIKRELAAFGARDFRLGIDFARPRRDAMHVELWGGGSELKEANERIRRAGWVLPKKLGQIAAYQRKLGLTGDDHHGPRTTAAVKSFQRRNGLYPDGYVGRRTLTALGLSGLY